MPEKFHIRRKNRNFAQTGGLHDDPLGLSVERSDAKISDSELREFFSEEKTSDIGSENFDPGQLRAVRVTFVFLTGFLACCELPLPRI